MVGRLLNLFPAPFHRKVMRVGHWGRRYWWRIRKPDLFGCRVLAFDEEGRVLLIRHSYGSDEWMLPGGGVGRGEDSIIAASRELQEETACILAEPRLVATLIENLLGSGNKVDVVVGRGKGPPAADGREVMEARFFSLDRLPDKVVEYVARDVPGWVALYQAQSKES